MKYLLYTALPLCLLAACSTPAAKAPLSSFHAIPAPGTLVATDSMPIKGELLNHFKFSVTIKATDNSKYGVYDIIAADGPSSVNGQFTMPRGGEGLVPVLRRAGEAETYVIGFRYGSDTAFYKYYQAKCIHPTGQPGTIEMKYLKGYSFK